jgi:error-prone DNA polymerase
LSLSLKAHPLSLLRPRMAARGLTQHKNLGQFRNGDRVSVGGLVLVRQRPGTAKGVIFATLEDETGVANVIVWPPIFEKFRRTLLASRLLAVHGTFQRQGLVMHVVADRLEDLSSDLDLLTAEEPYMDAPLARADGVKHQGPERRVGIRRSPRDADAAPLIQQSRDFH